MGIAHEDTARSRALKSLLKTLQHSKISSHNEKTSVQRLLTLKTAKKPKKRALRNIRADDQSEIEEKDSKENQGRKKKRQE